MTTRASDMTTFSLRHQWASILVPGVATTAFLYLSASGDMYRNWWASFILLAAVMLFAGAGLLSRVRGWFFRVLSTVSTQAGLVALALSQIFLWNVPMSIGWPVLLMLASWAGVSLSWHIPDGGDGVTLPAVRNTGIGISLLGVFLGLPFLLHGFGLINLIVLSESVQWWGVFILAAGLIALGNAFVAYTRTGRQVSVWTQLLLGIGIAGCLNGTLTLLGVPWTEWAWWTQVAIAAVLALASRSLAAPRGGRNSHRVA